MIRLFRLWFGLGEPVSRGAYAATGFGLAAVKYALDSAALYWVTGQFWPPWQYLVPLASLRQAPALAFTLGGTALAAAWSLPFVWIGASMTLRRAADAGLSPWVSVFFFVPGVNYIVMLLLCVLPSRRRPFSETVVRTPGKGYRLASPVIEVSSAAGLGALLGLVIFGISVYWLEAYGTALFVGAPFVMGLVTAYLFNRQSPKPFGLTVGVVALGLAMAGGVMLLGALEGLVCLVMAFPLAFGLAVLGAVLGVALARGAHSVNRSVGAAVVALPLMLAGDAAAPEPLLRRVVTVVDVDAPPAVVWDHVIHFTELPRPTDLWFRLGIAHPVRARLDGAGVGAVRRCEFSTGAFVEPITVWDPPIRLAFDVRDQPRPLEEWSPYRHVAAPHLLGSLRSRRGEFLLTPMPDGGTQVQGTTWYTLDMEPGSYWRLWSDSLIHRIHRRVLDHVRAEAEADPRAR